MKTSLQAGPSAPRQTRGHKEAGKLEPKPAGAIVKKLMQPTAVVTEASVDRIAFAPDGKRLVVQVRSWIDVGGKATITGRMLQVRDARNGALERTLLDTAAALLGVAWAGDGKSVATSVSSGKASDPHLVKLYDPSSGKEKALLKESQASYHIDLDFSADSRLLAAGGTIIDNTGKTTGGAIAVWDVATAKLLWQNRDHTHQVNGVAVSPDGKLVASASGDKTVRLWDAQSGNLKSTLEGHGEQGVYSVAFSADSKLLATGGLDGTVRLWDAAAAELKKTIGGYKKGAITMTAFTPDGKILVTGGSAATPDEPNVKLWSVTTGDLHALAPEPVEGFRSLALSPDGRTLAVGTWQKQLLLFALK